ncbi:MAG: hypothetical protein KKB50_14920 [Planctomycetes bacterium]|nr:hypothetical protein [Planctomycetota bacterium]
MATWKLPKGKTWQQKLREQHANHGKVVPIPTGMRKRYGEGTMLIPGPLDVDALMRRPRKGKLITVSQIRAALAAQAQADHACPLTTGMFIRLAAEAAAEAQRAGKQRVTPYWRTIRDDGSVHEKLPGGGRALATRLRQEGFSIQAGRGKKPPRIKDFEQYLVKL